MLMRFKDFDAGFQLGDYKKLKNRNQKFEKIFDEQLPESSILVNGNDEIEFFKEYFAGDNLIGGLNWLLQIVNDLPIKGTYTVPELNLKDATFKEVLEAVRNYYVQKLSTYKKRTAKV